MGSAKTERRKRQRLKQRQPMQVCNKQGWWGIKIHKLQDNACLNCVCEYIGRGGYDGRAQSGTQRSVVCY
jgi:hypothetical protein